MGSNPTRGSLWVRIPLSFSLTSKGFDLRNWIGLLARGAGSEGSFFLPTKKKSTTYMHVISEPKLPASSSLQKSYLDEVLMSSISISVILTIEGLHCGLVVRVFVMFFYKNLQTLFLYLFEMPG